MVVPIRRAKVKSGRACQLPPGLQVLHAYTTIFLKKGACVVHVISAMLVPPEEVPSEQAEGMQAPKE